MNKIVVFGGGFLGVAFVATLLLPKQPAPVQPSKMTTATASEAPSTAPPPASVAVPVPPPSEAPSGPPADPEVQFAASVKLADQVAKDAHECDTPKSIADAWEGVRQVPRTSRSYRAAVRAAAGLERCRVRVIRTLDDAGRKLMVTQREQWAERYEQSLVDGNVDARVTLQGPHKDRATVKWVLVNRPLVNKLGKDPEFLGSLQKIGLRRVTFTDGFYESFYFDLSPEDESGIGRRALSGMGLGEKLAL